MHPYYKHAHKNDPKWVRGLDKFTEKAEREDVDAVVRNYGSDRKVTEQATYEEKK